MNQIKKCEVYIVTDIPCVNFIAILADLNDPNNYLSASLIKIDRAHRTFIMVLVSPAENYI